MARGLAFSISSNYFTINDSVSKKNIHTNIKMCTALCSNTKFTVKPKTDFE